ncbi:MAG: CoA pyrophosphatase [bacterium]|nr:CoA pyrophosphatase [bacterium]
MNNNDLEKVIEELPASPNVLGRDKYINSAVVVPLIKINQEYHLLFQQRTAGIRQGSEICFPGGLFDPEKDENYQQTAVRETIEELGIDTNKIKIKGQFDTLVAPLGVTIDSFLGVLEIEDLSELNINKDEVERVFTLPVSYFRNIPVEKYNVCIEMQPSYIDENGETITLLPVKDLGLPERYTRPWGGKQYRVFVYKTSEGVIWGVTAEIINEFINKRSPDNSVL